MLETGMVEEGGASSGTKLYVSNLHFGVTNDDIKVHFLVPLIPVFVIFGLFLILYFMEHFSTEMFIQTRQREKEKKKGLLAWYFVDPG